MSKPFLHIIKYELKKKTKKSPDTVEIDNKTEKRKSSLQKTETFQSEENIKKYQISKSY